MEKIVRAMMDLIASEVCGRPIDPAQFALTDEELAVLYRLSKYHDLAHIVGNALLRHGLLPDGEIRRMFKRQVVIAVYRGERVSFELQRLRDAFNKAGIPFIPLKGAVLRRYYSEPWMRTSCDIDILVREEDLEAATAVPVEMLSYKLQNKGNHDVSLYAENDLHLELHYSLIEEGRIAKTQEVFSRIWEHARRVGDTAEYVLDDAEFYYYHVAHMAKHFLAMGGCGIRPFLDLWLMETRVAFDREKREAVLEKGGLEVFAAAVQELSHVWFGGQAPTARTMQMQNFLLRGGVYGSTQNRVMIGQVKRGSRIGYAFSRIWLRRDKLENNYPSLRGKAAILIPFYQMRRWLRHLFTGNIVRVKNEMKMHGRATQEQNERLKGLLAELGLSEFSG